MNSLRVIWIMILFLMICSFNEHSAGKQKFDPARVYSIPELQEDFRAMRKEMEKKQPNLYLYNSKERMDFVFDSLYKGIDRSMTFYEFYFYITPLGSIIKDGHNIILPGEVVGKYSDKHQGYFPLHITAVGDHLYSDMNCSRDSSIADGVEILSINGKSAIEVKHEFLTRMVRDGYNETFPLWILNTYFRGFYGFLYGFPDNYSMVLTNTDGTTDSVNIAALPMDTIVKIRKEKYSARVASQKSKEGLSLRFVPKSSVAVMTIQSFDPKTLRKGTHQNFRREIHKYFRQLDSAKTENLIIDVRNNGGGNPTFSRVLLQYLMGQPFRFASKTLQTRRINPGQRFSRIVNCRAPGFGKGQFKPVKHPYRGSVFVLINGGSFSATGEFASAMKRNNRGVFIGEETGGNHVIGGGQVFNNKLTLPNTGIECIVGTEATILGDIAENDGHGTMPDYFVENSLNDIIANRDAVMEFALDLARK